MFSIENPDLLIKVHLNNPQIQVDHKNRNHLKLSHDQLQQCEARDMSERNSSVIDQR